MGFRVTIKCTDAANLGVYLHGRSLPEPRPLPQATTHAGAQPVLDPGDYAVHLIDEFGEPGAEVKCVITGKTGERTCTFTIDDNHKLVGRCAFRLEGDGAVR